MDKSAQNTFALHPLLKQRWSPRAFSSTAIEPEKIRQMLEAARWSPSSSNEQPWRFILGFNGDETHQKIFSTLVEFNQLWANTAPILMLAIGNTMSLKKPDQTNPAYKYDVGQAVAHLTFQAMADGLFVHQMGGFDTKKAALLLEVPFGFEVLTALAIGYIGNPEVLHPNLKKSEIALRERRPLDELVFGKAFGETLSLVKP